jgi:hypothetical protein
MIGDSLQRPIIRQIIGRRKLNPIKDTEQVNMFMTKQPRNRGARESQAKAQTLTKCMQPRHHNKFLRTAREIRISNLEQSLTERTRIGAMTERLLASQIKLNPTQMKVLRTQRIPGIIIQARLRMAMTREKIVTTRRKSSNEKC